jgi:hypothetical protein
VTPDPPRPAAGGGGTIAERLATIERRIGEAARRAGRDPKAVTLIAVAKTHPPEMVQAAFAAGARAFGENYVQELRAKQEALAALGPDLRWHLIGHLQKNKAKDVVGRVALIHGVDDAALADTLGGRAARAGVVQDVLIEVNVGGEASKAGVEPAALPGLVDHVRATPGLRLRGLMCIPPPPPVPEANRGAFRSLAALARAHGLGELSMGMSDDFEVAVEEGATLVRVGTAIFGPRPERAG